MPTSLSCSAAPVVMPGYTRNEAMLAVQFVALGLPGDGVTPGVCLSAEFSTACNSNLDTSLCAWQNVRARDNGV